VGTAQERDRSSSAEASRRPASDGVAQIDAASQMDQARLAMIHGDYIAAQMHIKAAMDGTEH
jgi:hypothetical protein